MGNAVQIVGYKKTGKTTLVCRLTERFAAQGLRVGTVKHDGHDFDPDVPGTDSWRHRQAGAAVTAISSDTRTAWFEERPCDLAALLSRMADVDIVLVEGWKREKHPKVVLVQTESDAALLEELSNVAAAVSWDERIVSSLEMAGRVRGFLFDDTERIASFLLQFIRN